VYRFEEMNIAPKALISVLSARPFNTTFTRQMNSARSLYGKQLVMPKMNFEEIHAKVKPFLAYYAKRDRGIIADRVIECILLRQKAL